MTHKKKLPNKKSPTAEVVRAAMKQVEKDVRAPKVVRDGIVKPKKKKIEDAFFSPKINFAPDSNIDSIILDDSIKFKAKHIKNIPRFSTTTNLILIPSIGDEEFGNVRYVPGKINCGDVRVEIEGGWKKLSKLMRLFIEERKISFVMSNTNGLKITSVGLIKEVANEIENGWSFTYLPDHFSVL
jgi:hypothetical protein